jgi:hypothetical protein
VVVIGQHRAGAGPSHAFVAPTPAEGAVINAQYIPFFGGSFGADFQVRAHIYNNNVRYRQYVRGSFTYNGVAQPHQLHGGNLDPMNFIEDGNANGVYGVRGQNIPHLSVYQHAVDANGIACDLFIGNDTPADPLTCLSGTAVGIDLAFLGKIVDVNPPHFCYIQRRWYVRGNYLKP